VRRLAAELRPQGDAVSHQTPAELLHELGYSLPVNRKMLEGSAHSDRSAQFAHLAAAVQRQLSLGAPVVSVNTHVERRTSEPRLNGRASVTLVRTRRDDCL